MEDKSKTAAGSGNVNEKLGMIGMSNKFAVINRLITRDLNNDPQNPIFKKYTKENIAEYLSDPNRYEKNLRDAINYIYGASPHFRRLIQYFVSLSDLSYVVSPYRINPKRTNVRITDNNYRKVLNTLSAMSIKTQFPKILQVCLREDVFYGTFRVSSDSIIVQRLPSDYCKISSIENNVPNVTFNFQYFDSRPKMLQYFPEEFAIKYNLYKKDRMTRWIELDAPTSFAVKYNGDILTHPLPPFMGLLPHIYSLADYEDLRLAKTALENYAMIVMTLPMDDEGNWKIDLPKARDFWKNLDDVLPPEIGSVLTPMETDKISFERTHAGDTSTVVEAEQSIYTAAGVQSLLFNNPSASATALLLSIKVDQALTFQIVKAIEDVVNRYIWYQGYGKNFKVTFLDVSPFNREQAADEYLKAAQNGLPAISMYSAAIGLGQAELDAMNFLERDVLGLVESFRPLRNSAQMSGEEVLEEENAEGGRPEKEGTELTDSGEQSREDSDDWDQSADV